PPAPVSHLDRHLPHLPATHPMADLRHHLTKPYYALFSFPSLAAYEQYRSDSMSDSECQQAFDLARETRCIKRYERRFLRPLDDLS
ncbi:NIPSNAP family protein, partial [Streptomyces sp. wa13]|uniref:NIPSNAP family protein n=1 Tax=Streptomyces sp. wa13 TaxID=1828236 RepID=UPI003C79D2FC